MAIRSYVFPVTILENIVSILIQKNTIPRNHLVTAFSKTTKTFQIEFGGLFGLRAFKYR